MFSTGSQRAPVDIAFVSMPFGPLGQPSIGLSLLRAALPPSVRSTIFYFTIDFAERVGTHLYDLVADGFPETTALVGEWLFARDVYGADALAEQRYVDEILRGDRFKSVRFDATPKRAEFVDSVRAAAEHVPTFLDECTERILAAQPRIVAFTTVFQQSLASIALARRIKLRDPSVTVVFGGANCEGIMGVQLVRSFACIDAAVSGEGEIVFPQIAAAVLERCAVPDDLAGVSTRANVADLDACGIGNAPGVAHMDDLPVPRYDDFIEQYTASSFAAEKKPMLLFETSRGCWWGERNHCTFCGLNGATMKFRSKSQARALAELGELTARYAPYGVDKVAAVDNILDTAYFREFLPALAERRSGFELFYEVKANMRREQVVLLKQAGVTVIQPGIESLSTHVLTVMRKGVRAIQNVQLLKWCKELGISANWNLLFGFPAEDPADYAEMARMLPHVMHLRPPVGAADIRLDRFSPNFDHAEASGFRDLAPYPAYDHVYPLDETARRNLAYFFTFTYADGRDVQAYTREVREHVDTWKREYESSDLLWIDEGARLLLLDTRPFASAPITQLRGLARELLLRCDEVRSFDDLRAHAAQALPQRPLSDDALRAALGALESSGYLMREKNLYLSLAIAHGTYPLMKSSVERFKERVRERREALAASPSAA
jgi:ribosomal peptide maturation radical SAM protein 1